ncbi:excisionase family DNA binding protein [Bradyrhizobium japonicum]|nr:helix-turn-helix domain-containing protein [Bradyrhizobium liaoningense]MCP1774876.1 excisionase family DNA binding protein [Bradyrhizobium japonicum]MCP1962123.1 excisionase family DNA binding protein [Bradyrhizobium japonicum]MCS3977565.1 excisionase family DNA binding protein [Bradyrhizobium japonicum]
MSDMVFKSTTKALAVSPREAAEILGCGRTRIYQLLQLGELISYREGAARRILTSSIHHYVERQVEAQAETPRWSCTIKATQASLSKRGTKDSDA